MKTLIEAEKNKKSGVDEGDRTLDRRSHNPELYQLSYVHHNQDIPFGTYNHQLCCIGDYGADQADACKWRARQDSNLRPPA